MANLPHTLDIIVSERYSASPGRIRRLLDNLADFDNDTHTTYLRPYTVASARSRAERPKIYDLQLAGWFREIANQTGDSETGAVVFWAGNSATVILPPFPIDEDHFHSGINALDLLGVFDRDVTLGVVLLRLGRYAVGVVRGKKLLSSKTDTRYVKNRHRAGGSSQRRFMRSRDRLIRELYDEVWDVTRRVFEPHLDNIDYVFTGGERQTVNGFLKRCDLFEKSGVLVMERLLAVDRPSHKALEEIYREIWKSRVLVFERVG